jgi:hypothetical protein
LLPVTRTALLFLFLSSAVFGADKQWHWIKASNNADPPWAISKGDAEVEINDGKLDATLFWEGSTKIVRISLKGSLVNGNLTVKETGRNADLGGSTYTGKLIVQEWKKPAPGKTEVITLSDGFSMIGLTRTSGK